MNDAVRLAADANLAAIGQSHSVRLVAVTLRAEDLKVRFDGLAPSGHGDDVVDVQANFIRHVLAANLARIVIALHDASP